MERKPADSFATESSTEDAKDKDAAATKKKSFARLPIQAPVAERPHTDQAEKPKKQLFDFIEATPTVAAAESAVEDGAEAAAAEDKELVTLSPEERQHISQAIADEHLESKTSTEAAAPDVVFLERVQDGQDIEVAFTEVASELGLTDQEIDEALAETPHLAETEIYDQALPAESEPDSSEQDDEQEIILRAPARSAIIPATGGADTPPPPRPPAGQASPRGGTGGGRPNARPGTTGFNTAPRLPTEAKPIETESFASRRNRAGELIVVGLVGYLVGRRRGRISTEKRLLPVQKKLEKQVIALEQNISHKEQQLAAAQMRVQERIRPQSARDDREPKAPTEQRMQPGRHESRLGLAKPVQAEHMAHMIVAAEAPRVTEKRTAERPTDLSKSFRAEVVKDMSRAELLEVSDKIVVEGASLRQIYETRLISEKQLRHIVGEHLQGKDIHKTLRREMVEHEIDFERDPMMRDRVHEETVRAGGGLGDMLARAGMADAQADNQLQRQVQKEARRRADIERKQQQQRLVTDVAMVTAVVVLAVAVVILALRG